MLWSDFLHHLLWGMISRGWKNSLRIFQLAGQVNFLSLPGTVLRAGRWTKAKLALRAILCLVAQKVRMSLIPHVSSSSDILFSDTPALHTQPVPAYCQFLQRFLSLLFDAQRK